MTEGKSAAGISSQLLPFCPLHQQMYLAKMENTFMPITSEENIDEVAVKTPDRFEARAKIIKAMAHPTRLFIVDELSRVEERCVCELTEMIGADISTVSKHLTILKNAGIVNDDKRGNQVYYSLRVPCILEFFRCVESVIQCSAKKGAKLLK